MSNSAILPKHPLQTVVEKGDFQRLGCQTVVFWQVRRVKQLDRPFSTDKAFSALPFTIQHLMTHFRPLEFSEDSISGRRKTGHETVRHEHCKYLIISTVTKSGQ
jgi:hypothetical protein